MCIYVWKAFLSLFLAIFVLSPTSLFYHYYYHHYHHCSISFSFCLFTMAAAGPANPVSGALAILDATDLDLEHCSTLQEVSASLMAIDCMICKHRPPSHPMCVHGKVVYYNNANSQTSHFNVYCERNPEHAKQFAK